MFIRGGTDRLAARGVGYDHLHVCVDDASRLADVELLPSLGQEDATGFLERALAWCGRHGVTVQRVTTDNGSAYRAGIRLAAALCLRIKGVQTL